MTTAEERFFRNEQAGFQPVHLMPKMFSSICFTDSETGAMSRDQWPAIQTW